MTVYDGDCLDGPEGCEGETFPRPALSGSGDSYSRCDRHDALYVERVQPMMDELRDWRKAVRDVRGEPPTICGERLLNLCAARSTVSERTSVG
jgi:hypothetical protein